MYYVFSSCEPVLVEHLGKWQIGFFLWRNYDNKCFTVQYLNNLNRPVKGDFKLCIPYKNNENKLGTTVEFPTFDMNKHKELWNKIFIQLNKVIIDQNYDELNNLAFIKYNQKSKSYILNNGESCKFAFEVSKLFNNENISFEEYKQCDYCPFNLNCTEQKIFHIMEDINKFLQHQENKSLFNKIKTTLLKHVQKMQNCKIKEHDRYPLTEQNTIKTKATKKKKKS